MSLINDALKRAKEAQQPPAPSPSTQLNFRPIETNQIARHGFGLMMPVAFALVALLVLFLGWELAQKNAATKQAGFAGQSELVARAASPPTTSAPATAPAAPPVAEPAPEPPSPGDERTPSTASATPAAAPLPVPDTPAAPPKPLLRLQSIVFNPSRPSAMINGKIVLVGDKIGEFRVSAITQTSATLFNSSQTNTLELGE